MERSATVQPSPLPRGVGNSPANAAKSAGWRLQIRGKLMRIKKLGTGWLDLGKVWGEFLFSMGGCNA